MYPQPTNLSPSTSNATPKPTSIFQPSSTDKSTESSPQSSLPCGQREHLQHRLALHMHHLHIHHHSHLYTHNINPRSLHPHSTPHQNPINNKFNKHLLKQMLTSLLSLPFQMKINSVYPNPQIVVR